MTKIFSAVFASILMSVTAHAGSSTMMVAIQRTTVQPNMVAKAIDDLGHTYNDVSFGQVDCSYKSRVENFLGEDIFGSDAPYYGVAFVKMSFQNQCGFERAVQTFTSDSRYMFYANPQIDGHPAVSGRN